MAAHHENEKDLPHVWPFTLAGVLLTVALTYFCVGFAIHDLGEELWGHYGVFWALVLVSGALIVGGATVNLTREHRRRKAL